MHRKTRSIAIGIAITSCLAIGTLPASAATPAVKGCVGKSVSSFSSTIVRSGWLYRDFAQAPGSRPGLGDDVQGLQTGAVPDAVFPNSCNR